MAFAGGFTASGGGCVGARMIHCGPQSPDVPGPISPMPVQQSSAERELAELIVTALNLEGVSAEQIDPEQPLFGTELGLDSIDALEIALAVSKRYGFQLRSEGDDNRRIFASLRALSAHIEQQRPQ